MTSAAQRRRIQKRKTSRIVRRVRDRDDPPKTFTDALKRVFAPELITSLVYRSSPLMDMLDPNSWTMRNYAARQRYRARIAATRQAALCRSHALPTPAWDRATYRKSAA